MRKLFSLFISQLQIFPLSFHFVITKAKVCLSILKKTFFFSGGPKFQCSTGLTNPVFYTKWIFFSSQRLGHICCKTQKY